MEGDYVSENYVWEMYESGWSVGEIADTLGVSVNEVENILFG